MTLCLHTLDAVIGGNSSTNPGIIAASVVIPIVLLIAILLLVIVLIRRFQQHNKIYEFTIDKIAETYTAVNPLFDRVQVEANSGSHEKEYASQSICFVRELGEGAFGRVYQGIATNIIAGEDSTVVAVKQLKTNTSVDDDAVIVDFFKG